MLTRFPIHFALFVVVAVAVVPQVEAQQVGHDSSDGSLYRATLQRAKRGNLDAQLAVAEMYEKGFGVDVDMKKSVYWLEKAVERNNEHAKFKLAYLYYRGEGVESNPSRAFLLMEELAKANHTRAQFYLGLMYEVGVVVKRNVDLAAKWYMRAATDGHEPAAESLAELIRLYPGIKFETPPPAPVIAAALAKSEPLPAPIAGQDHSLTGSTPETAAVTAVATTGTVAHRVAAETSTVDGTVVESAGLADNIEPDSSNAHVETVMTPAESSTPAPHSFSTFGALTEGVWQSSPGHIPVEYLPSLLTTCERTANDTISCASRDMLSRVGRSEVLSRTQAIISQIRENGEFLVSYRKNVLQFTSEANTDAGENNGEAPPAVQLGWQDTVHHLECKLESETAMHCTKNKTQKLTLTREDKL